MDLCCLHHLWVLADLETLVYLQRMRTYVTYKLVLCFFPFENVNFVMIYSPSFHFKPYFCEHKIRFWRYFNGLKRYFGSITWKSFKLWNEFRVIKMWIFFFGWISIISCFMHAVIMGNLLLLERYAGRPLMWVCRSVYVCILDWTEQSKVMKQLTVFTG